ncbi:MAG: hypothetical protein KAV43_03870 [Hadesarchaea archaeon]|nr:hypothetical protein [Hadesarchaea archaeon]
MPALWGTLGGEVRQAVRAISVVHLVRDVPSGEEEGVEGNLVSDGWID